MLRAMYDFQAPYENTLTFSENDLFVVLKRNNKDRDWVHVISLAGENGYVSILKWYEIYSTRLLLVY